jgi:hypothetical protein
VFPGLFFSQGKGKNMNDHQTARAIVEGLEKFTKRAYELANDCRTELAKCYVETARLRERMTGRTLMDETLAAVRGEDLPETAESLEAARFLDLVGQIGAHLDKALADLQRVPGAGDQLWAKLKVPVYA